MSVEATSLALNLAPVPAGRGWQPSSASKFVLVGLANHATPDGTGAFPSVATLVRYTGLSERTVRTCQDRLQTATIIAPCDPGHRRGTDKARRPPPARLGLEPEPRPATTWTPPPRGTGASVPRPGRAVRRGRAARR